MAMKAETVELLMHKGKFQPETALAVAEAIDRAHDVLQPVTVPVLDSRLADSRREMDARFTEMRATIEVRFAQMDTKFARLKSDLIFWIVAVVVGNSYLPKLAETITAAISRATG